MATIYTRAAKGSALTWTEGDANITNLNNAKIENVVEDTTPQLGGNLDVNGNSIVSASNGNISITPNGTGSVVIDGNTFPQTQGAQGQILVADGGGLLEWANQEKLTAYVYNADSVTINKGEPVYVFSAQGDQISVKRALNTGDATSAQTLGLAAANIAATASGVVICQGVLTNVDTSTYTAGQALYLGATAGSVTTTKPSEPNHLVYLGFVEKVNASSGRIYVRVQNGYELAEIHDVNINNAVAIADNHYLRYNLANDRWQNSALDISHDTSPELGGNLDVKGYNITNSTGDMKVSIYGVKYPNTNGTNGQVLTSDGTGNANWSTPASGGITDLVQDTTPQLGGNLDVQNFNIQTSTTNGDIFINGNGTGNIVLAPSTGEARVGGNFRVNANYELRLGDADNSNYVGFKAPTTVSTNKIWTLPSADGTNGQVLSTDGSGTLSWTSASGGGLTDIVQDTTPQLGGNLDVQNYNITTSVTNGDIFINGNGSGNIVLAPSSGEARVGGNFRVNANYELRLGDSDNSNYVGFKAPATVNTNKVWILPDADGTNGQTLVTNGSGTLSWATAGGLTDIVQDTTPQLGGNLDVQNFNIQTSTTNGDIFINGNGSGNIVLAPSSGEARIGGNFRVNANYELRLGDADNSNYVGFKAPTTVATNKIWTLPSADGTSNQVLTTDGSGTLSWATPSSAYPQITDDTSTNATRYILFDNVTSGDASSVGVSSTKLTFNPSTGILSASGFSGPINGTVGATTPAVGTFTTLTVNAANDLRLADSDSSNYVGFKSPATVSANKIWTLPSADGTANQVLKTDGSGTLGWATVSSGASNPAYISMDNSQGTLISGSTYRVAISEVQDTSSLITVSSNQFTVGAGTYVIEQIGHVRSADANWYYLLRNVTAGSNLDTFNGFVQYKNTSNTNTYSLLSWAYIFTASGSTTYEMRCYSPSADVVAIGNAVYFKITKL